MIAYTAYQVDSLKDVNAYSFVLLCCLTGGFPGSASVCTNGNGSPDTTNIGVMFDLWQAFDTHSINLYVLSNTIMIDVNRLIITCKAEDGTFAYNSKSK